MATDESSCALAIYGMMKPSGTMQARQILVQNPQLTKALFQAQIMLGMVKNAPQVLSPPLKTAGMVLACKKVLVEDGVLF